jgi:hypothetical protein
MARDRNLKYLVAYAGFREWRWHAHKNQLDRERKRGPRQSTPSGVIFWVIVGVFCAGLSIPWYMIFGSLTFFIMMNVIWNLVVIFVCAAGIQEARQRKARA